MKLYDRPNAPKKGQEVDEGHESEDGKRKAKQRDLALQAARRTKLAVRSV